MDIILVATFVLYFVLMIGIGAYFYNRSAKMKEYFLADRGLNPYVVALSAQASDMSGWLLMGLPGAIVVAGVGEVWVGIGLAIGTYLAWLLVAKRLRIYSEKVHNSITISEYFSNRFKEDKGIIRVLCGITILVFFTVYVASAFVAGGNTLMALFPEGGYQTLMLVGAAIVIVYTFLGGFKAVCWTDFFQGLLMVVAIVVVPLALAGELGGVDAAWDAVENIAGTDPGFSIDFISCGWIAIVSGLAWGLGYFGMPHILVRYMSIKDPEAIKVSRRVATTWVVVSLSAACMIGLIGRAWAETQGFISPDGTIIGGFNSELIFIEAVNSLWAVGVPVLAGVLFAALMAAVMSTADSQLLVAASAVSNDIYKHFKGKDVPEVKLVWISRVIIIVIAIVAALIALDRESSIMNLVSFAWAGFGAAFGPLMLLSLFWKRTNGKGAIAGILTGFVTVILWNTFLRSGIITSEFIMDTPVTGVYELLPGFVFAFIAIVVVSLITSKPDAEMIAIHKAVGEECGRQKASAGKIAGFAGIAVAILVFIVLHFSYRLSGYGIDEIAVEELSIMSGSVGVTAFLGTFVAGFFLLVFSLGLAKCRCGADKLAGIAMAIAAIGLMVAGFLDLTYTAHDIGCYVFAIAGIVSVTILLLKDFASGRTVSAGLMAVFIALGAGLGLGMATWSLSIMLGIAGCVLVQSLRRIASPDEN